MPEEPELRIDLVCEDRAQEATARALIERCAREEGARVSISAVTACGGLPMVRGTLRALRPLELRGSRPVPDILVVLADANRQGVAERRRELADAFDASQFPAVVIGVPDPYVERWLLADPAGLRERFGTGPDIPATEERVRWKQALRTVLKESGEIVTGDGSEFAPEIVESMDHERARRAL